MNKKMVGFSILIVGICVTTYGLATAPVINHKEIRSNYKCDRLTKDARTTDEYCYNTYHAPEAKKNYGNSFVYTGAAIIALGALSIFAVSYAKEK